MELAKLVGVETIVKKAGLNKEYTADNTLLLKELNGFEFTDYRDGMSKMITILGSYCDKE